MADNTMYWSETHGWYQPSGPPQNHQAPPPAYQSASPYQAAGSHVSASHASTSPPTHNQQHQMIPNGSSNGNHMNHMQSTMPSQAPPNQPVASAINHYNQPPNIHHEQPPPPAASQLQTPQMDSSSGYPMQQQSYAQPRLQQQQPQQQHPPQQQQQSQMYSQTNLSASESSSYPIAPQSNQNLVPNSQPSGSNQGPPLMSSMQQQQQLYPQQQYSPAPYWNPGPPTMQNYQQSMYGPPQNGPQGPIPTQPMHHQGSVPTPPSSIPENPSSYHAANGTNPPGPPPPQSQQAPSQQQQQQSSTTPYDGRGSNMSANYNTSYQQPAPGYYSSHEIQQQPQAPIATDSYEHHHITHQQGPQPPPNPHQTWSNGYYQPNNNSPYSSAQPINPYSSIPTYNGNQSNNTSSGHPQHNSSHMQGMHPNQMHPPSMQHHHQPNHMPHHQQHPNQIHNHHGPPPNYPGHPQPPTHQQHMNMSQQPWASQQQQPQQNHTIPIIDRNNKSGQDKKPVKARAPKKQSNPNAPPGRRKRSSQSQFSEEAKKSGYAKFFQIKCKELGKEPDFGQTSKTISENWARLSEQERAAYQKDVSIKRKDMLKKKAAQQAQDLLVHTQGPDVIIHSVKKE